MARWTRRPDRPSRRWAYAARIVRQYDVMEGHPVITDLFAPGGGDGPRLRPLLLAVAAGLAAAQSEAWASALGTAAGVYAVVVGSGRNRRR